MLVELVPDGRVYAVDVAPSMVEHTRAALGDKVTAFCQDLTELVAAGAGRRDLLERDLPLDPGSPEAVREPRGGAQARRSAGRAVRWLREHRLLQGACGRGRQTARVRRRTSPTGRGRGTTPAPISRRSASSAAGFIEVETWLEPRPTPLDDPEPFVRTVCLVRHLDRLPEDLHEDFIRAVLARTGSPLVLEYVRLNMVARRARMRGSAGTGRQMTVLRARGARPGQAIPERDGGAEGRLARDRRR